MTRTRTKAADIKTDEQLEREKQALHLRKSGASYRAIGDKLGISHEQARRDVATALSYIRDDVTADAVNLRDLELARLDDLLLKLQTRLSSENERVSDRAYGRAMQIIEQRAKLAGLFAPQKFEEVTWQSEIIALMRDGKLTREQVEQELGTDLATEFFKSTGLPVTTTRES